MHKIIDLILNVPFILKEAYHNVKVGPLEGYAFQIDEDFAKTNDSDPNSAIPKNIKYSIGDWYFIASNRDYITVIRDEDFKTDFAPNLGAISFYEYATNAGVTFDPFDESIASLYAPYISID